MKLLKLLSLLFLCLLITSCNSDEENNTPSFDQEPIIIPIENYSTRAILYFYPGQASNATGQVLIYKKKDSDDEWQYADMGKQQIASQTVEIKDLMPNTSYELRIEAKSVYTDSNKSIRSKATFFTTKCVDFDFNTFMKKKTH